MKLRRFNRRGLERFTEWLEDLKRDPSVEDPPGLLDDAEFTMLHPSECEVEALNCTRRYELGIELERALAPLPDEEAYGDVEMWAWLTYLNRDLVLPRSHGSRKRPGEHARYIPSTEWNRRYRHLLRGPWHLVRLHRSDPSCLELILVNPPDTPGELYEQLASRLDLVASGGVMSALQGLYYSSTNKKPKRGAMGKGTPGTSRRFGKLLNQLILTYHVPEAAGASIRELLPGREFDRFDRSA